MLAQTAGRRAVERWLAHAAGGNRDLVAVLDILDVALAGTVAHRLDDLFLGAAQETLAVGQALALRVEAPVNDVHSVNFPFVSRPASRACTTRRAGEPDVRYNPAPSYARRSRNASSPCRCPSCCRS